MRRNTSAWRSRMSAVSDRRLHRIEQQRAGRAVPSRLKIGDRLVRHRRRSDSAMDSMARVKRRMRRSRPTIPAGMLMLSRDLSDPVDWLNSRLLSFSFHWRVFSSSLADSSSSWAVSSSSLPAAPLRCRFSSPAWCACPSTIDCKYSLVAASSRLSRALPRFSFVEGFFTRFACLESRCLGQTEEICVSVGGNELLNGLL